MVCVLIPLRLKISSTYKSPAVLFALCVALVVTLSFGCGGEESPEDPSDIKWRIETLTGAGAGPGEASTDLDSARFDNITSISAIDEGLLLITDNRNDLVRLVDVNGDTVTSVVGGGESQEIGRIRKSEIQLDAPMFADVDAEGQVYFVDRTFSDGDGVIWRASLEGGWVEPVMEGVTIVQFDVAPDGTIFYLTADREGIWILEPGEREPVNILNGARFRDLAAISGDRVYAATFEVAEARRIVEIDVPSETMTLVAGPFDANPFDPRDSDVQEQVSEFSPTYLAWGTDQWIYISQSDTTGEFIGRMNPETGETERVAGAGYGDSTGDGGSALEAHIQAGILAVDPNGDLYFVNRDKIRVVYGAGGP